MGYPDPGDISKLPGFDLAIESDKRVLAREAKPAFDPWFKEALGLKPGEVVPEEFTGEDTRWYIYETRGAAAETGSYPTGPAHKYPSDDFALSEGTGTFGPKAPVRQISPDARTAYGRMSRALRREDAKTNLGVAWAGAFSGQSRDANLLLEGQQGRMEPQEIALDSALGLANLNMEQHGFTFPWDIGAAGGRGAPKYASEDYEKFKELGHRKSYVEREGHNVPLDDDCVEVVSLTKKGPIYKSTGKPGCP